MCSFPGLLIDGGDLIPPERPTGILAQRNEYVHVR